MFFREEHELHRRRFGRNLGLGLVLAAFVALVFALTVVKVEIVAERDGFDGATGQAALPGEAAR